MGGLLKVGREIENSKKGKSGILEQNGLSGKENSRETVLRVANRITKNILK